MADLWQVDRAIRVYLVVAVVVKLVVAEPTQQRNNCRGRMVSVGQVCGRPLARRRTRRRVTDDE